MQPRIAVRAFVAYLAVYAGTVGSAQGPWENQRPWDNQQERGAPAGSSYPASSARNATGQGTETVTGRQATSSFAIANTEQRSANSPTNQAIIRDRQFDIPFHVTQSGTQPSEVQLYVSRNSGHQWSIAARKAPHERQFTFTAPEDGVYWFATRTVDVTGQSYPQGTAIAPELAVLVDTIEPQCQLDAEANESGMVELAFSIVDASLRSATSSTPRIQLMYVSDSQRDRWIPLTLGTTSQLTPDSSGQLIGRVQFSPSAPWRYLQVRAVVTDAAGNQAVVDRQVERPRVAGVRAQLASVQQPAAGNPVPSNPLPQDQTAYDSGYSMPIGLPHASQSSPAMATVGSPDRAEPSSTANPGLVDSPLTSQPVFTGQGYIPATPAQHPDFYNGSPIPTRGFAYPQNPASTVSTPAMNQLSGPRLGIPNQESPAASTLANDQLVSNAPPGTPRSPASAMRPIEMETLPAPQGYRAQERSSEPSSDSQNLLEERTVSMRPSMPTIPEDQVRHTRLKTFELAYEIDSLGSQGISAVELWGSRDGGQTWSNWGTDEDRESPFDIETSGEGLYGFRIVVVGKNGLTSAIPQPGEAADIYVRVDQSAPLVHLTAARYGQDQEAGSLIIEYNCRDENLDPRPISLAFSGEPNGPWTTIATGLENTGRYAWPADPRLPKQIYLRIEAIDRSGNVGLESTPKPIDVRGLAPSAKIRGFRPIDP